MYDPMKHNLVDMEGCGILSESTNLTAGQYRCEVCGMLTKETKIKNEQLLEMCHVLGSSSSSRDQAPGLFTDVCATCMLKLVSVCQTVARAALLKTNPTTSMHNMADYFHIEYSPAAKKETEALPPIPLEAAASSASTRRRHHYTTDSTNAPGTQDSVNGTDAARIVADIHHGPLGIEFNTIGEVLTIKRNTQGYDIKGLSKGDRLYQIDTIHVEGMTTNEMMSVMKLRARPMQLTFVKHRDWVHALNSKGDEENVADVKNGLPDVDMEHVAILFNKHDQDESFALTKVEMASFMAEIHELSSAKVRLFNYEIW